MVNLSKIKRENMINFLNIIRNQHSDDESIRAICEIENQLIDKKYGLVWEEHIEHVDEMLKDNIPIFNEESQRKIVIDKDYNFNFILEGDNLQSLYLLEKTHKEKIDVIYIDPPYNTGAKDWKYNNSFVDKNDTYRHSKWLSMMSKRLAIAKNLLKDDGVLICAIDENELGTTLLLLHDVFGLQYSVDCIAILHNPRGIQGDNFSYVHEYALFVYKKGLKVLGTRELSQDEIDWSPFRNWGSESLREDAANCFYPIFVKDDKIIGFGDDITSESEIHPNKNEFLEEDGCIAIYPIDEKGIERKWRYARQTVESIVDLLRVKNSNGIYDIELGKDFAPYRTIWDDKKFDANEYGTQLINSMVPNNDFSFPKSLYNVEECIYAVTQNKPNAIILDYFAGSGTTGHAVLHINKTHGGNRKFILCTNNDVGEKKEKEYKKIYGEINAEDETWKEWQEKYGIASSVTFPRIKAAIEGFVHKKDFKTILFSKKLTYSTIKNSAKLIQTIEDIKTQYENSFEDFKVEVENENLILYGIDKKGKQIQGLPTNIKYFKDSWTPRKPENYLLSNALCLHIKEMIELQNAIEIDQKKNVLILNKDDFKNIILNTNIYDNIEKIWVNQNILFNAKEMDLLEHKGFSYIPKEFFGQELQEVAE